MQQFIIHNISQLITLDPLAKTKKLVNITTDDLAGMVQRGFIETNKNIKTIQDNVSILKDDTAILKDGQEQIKLRLDNVPYRFELVELQKRVQFLEKKLGVKYA